MTLLLKGFKLPKNLVNLFPVFAPSCTTSPVTLPVFLNGFKIPPSELKARNIFKSVKEKIVDGSEKDLKILEITVEEKPTGEVSAGAGVGTNRGSFAFNVQENNYLGEGKNVGFNIEIDQESVKGTLNYTNPNYDVLGNAIRY